MYHNHCYYDPEVVHNKFTYHGLSDNHLANSYCGRLCTPHRLISLIVYIIGTNVYCTNGIPRLDAAAIFLATPLCAATIRGRCYSLVDETSYDVIEHDAKWIPSPFSGILSRPKISLLAFPVVVAVRLLGANQGVLW